MYNERPSENERSEIEKGKTKTSASRVGGWRGGRQREGNRVGRVYLWEGGKEEEEEEANKNAEVTRTRSVRGASVECVPMVGSVGGVSGGFNGGGAVGQKVE